MGTSVTDDRGRRAPVYGMRGGYKKTAGDERLPRRLLRRMEATVFDRIVDAVVLGGGTALVLFIGLFATGAARQLDGGAWVCGGLPILAVVAILSWWFSMPSGVPNTIRRAMLDEGRCASCGYPIRTIAEAEDGCRVCPECGAAWRMPVASPPDTEAG